MPFNPVCRVVNWIIPNRQAPPQCFPGSLKLVTSRSTASLMLRAATCPGTSWPPPLFFLCLFLFLSFFLFSFLLLFFFSSFLLLFFFFFFSFFFSCLFFLREHGLAIGVYVVLGGAIGDLCEVDLRGHNGRGL